MTPGPPSSTPVAPVAPVASGVPSLKKSTNVGSVIGGVLGGVLFVGVSVGILVTWRRRKRRRTHDEDKRDSLGPIAIPNGTVDPFLSRPTYEQHGTTSKFLASAHQPSPAYRRESIEMNEIQGHHAEPEAQANGIDELPTLLRRLNNLLSRRRQAVLDPPPQYEQ